MALPVIIFVDKERSYSCLTTKTTKVLLPVLLPIWVKKCVILYIEWNPVQNEGNLPTEGRPVVVPASGSPKVEQ